MTFNSWKSHERTVTFFLPSGTTNAILLPGGCLVPDRVGGSTVDAYLARGRVKQITAQLDTALGTDIKTITVENYQADALGRTIMDGSLAKKMGRIDLTTYTNTGLQKGRDLAHPLGKDPVLFLDAVDVMASRATATPFVRSPGAKWVGEMRSDIGSREEVSVLCPDGILIQIWDAPVLDTTQSYVTVVYDEEESGNSRMIRDMKSPHWTNERSSAIAGLTAGAITIVTPTDAHNIAAGTELAVRITGMGGAGTPLPDDTYTASVAVNGLDLNVYGPTTVAAISGGTVAILAKSFAGYAGVR